MIDTMPVAVTIPKATISLEQVDIVEWKRAPGERVEKGETLFEMETDKVLVEVPAPASGILLRVDTARGIARVEQVVGWIGEAGEEPGAVDVAPAAAKPAAAMPAAGGERPENHRPAAATPAARRRARELGVEIPRVRGTGPDGRITEKDVESFAAEIEKGGQQ